MGYKITIKKKVLKNLTKTPKLVQKKLIKLLDDLHDKGPIQPDWLNYSKLNDKEYHCHLGMSWVACWRHEKKVITIEVYYVGSREKAPY